MCKNQTLINRIKKVAEIKLNSKQAEAVSYTEGVSVVQAGPGCGKTGVLVCKAVNISIEHPEANILAISYTKKAVNELQSRFVKLGVSNVHTSTIHSLLLKIMRTFDSNYKHFRFIENSAQRSSAITEAIRRCSLTETYTVDDVIKLLATGNLNDNDDNAAVLEEYLQILKEKHLLCFDSIIYLAIELLKAYPAAAHHVRNTIDYLLVDEYQDWNQPQMEALTLIFSRDSSSNVTFVGDKFQSIFGFRGADVSGLDDIISYYGCKTFTLDLNYRCSPEILQLAHAVLPESTILKANKTSSQITPTFYEAETSMDEAKFVVDEIKKLHADGIRYSDIAILTRITGAAGNVFDELIKEGIPVVKIGSDIGRYSNSRFKCLLSLLATLYAPQHASLYLKCSLPIIGAPASIMTYLANMDDKEDKSVPEILCSIPSLSKNQKQRFNDFFSIDIKKLTFFQVVEKLWSDYLKPWFRVEDDYIYQEFLETLGPVRNYIELRDEVMTYHRNIKKMNALIQHGEDHVTLASIHSVKGAEFSRVFLISASEGVLPCSKQDSQIDEENRLAYVAVTRGKDNVYVSYAKSINGNNQQPSRFFANFFNQTATH